MRVRVIRSRAKRKPTETSSIAKCICRVHVRLDGHYEFLIANKQTVSKARNLYSSNGHKDKRTRADGQHLPTQVN